jgi:hypothetical protein
LCQVGTETRKSIIGRGTMKKHMVNQLSPEEEYRYKCDEDEIENDDGTTSKYKRKKKKVFLKREQICKTSHILQID